MDARERAEKIADKARDASTWCMNDVTDMGEYWRNISGAAVRAAYEIDTCETCAFNGECLIRGALIRSGYAMDSYDAFGCNRHQPKEA